MKKICSLLLLCATVIFSACKDNPVPVAVSGVTLNKPTLSLVEGIKESLTATVAPNEVEDKSVTWTTSEPTVAAVNAAGEVNAIKAGTTTITATSVADKTKTAICVVTVTPATIAVTGVTVDPTTATFTAVGAKTQLTPTVAPADAANKTVTWGSSNTAVATVSATGEVTSVAVGNAVITATTTDGGKTATCEVTVLIDVRNAGYVTVAGDATGLPAGMLCVGKFGGYDGTTYTKALYIDKKGGSTPGVNPGTEEDHEQFYGTDGTTYNTTDEYNGLSNTTPLSAKSECHAAKYCAGKNMYLPALRQLKDGIYAAKDQTYLTAEYTFVGNTYWSSTEFNKSRAYNVNFSNGTESNNYKDNKDNVRCVLEF